MRSWNEFPYHLWLLSSDQQIRVAVVQKTDRPWHCCQNWKMTGVTFTRSLGINLHLSNKTSDHSSACKQVDSLSFKSHDSGVHFVREISDTRSYHISRWRHREARNDASVQITIARCAVNLHKAYVLWCWAKVAHNLPRFFAQLLEQPQRIGFDFLCFNRPI